MPERSAKRIADRLEDGTAVGDDRITHYSIMTLDGVIHRMLMRVPALARTFDVGEEERDGARRQTRTGHVRRSTSPVLRLPPERRKRSYVISTFASAPRRRGAVCPMRRTVARRCDSRIGRLSGRLDFRAH